MKIQILYCLFFILSYFPISQTYSQTSEKQDSIQAREFYTQGKELNQQGELLAAIRSFEKCIQTLPFEKYPKFEAAAHHYCGNLYMRIGNFHTARIFLARGLAIRKKYAEPTSQLIAHSLTGLGTALKFLGKADSALSLFDEALAIRSAAEKQKPEKIAILLENRSGALLELGDTAAALNNLSRALAIFRSEEVNNPPYACLTELSLGKVHLDLNQLELAFSYLTSAHETALKVYEDHDRNLAKVKLGLGYAYLKQDDPDKALALFHAALLVLLPEFTDTDPYTQPTPAQFTQDPQVLLTLEAKAEAFRRRYETVENYIPELEAALQSYELAFTQIDQMRAQFATVSAKEFLSEKTYASIENAIELAHNLSEHTRNRKALTRAFQFAERSKAMILLESMIELQHQQNLTNVDSVWSTYLSTSTVPLPLADIQNALPEGGALIEYYMGKDNLWIFKINHRGIQVVPKPRNEHWDDQIQQFVHMVSYPPALESGGASRKAFILTATQLYQYLLAPIFKDTIPTGNLTLIPDGMLWQVPFEALLLPTLTDSTLPFQRLRYVLTSCIPNYTPSGKIFLELHKKPMKKTTTGLIAFAPFGSSAPSSLTILPHSQQEVEQIVDIMGGQLFLGPQALESTIKRQSTSASVLHLATHGKAWVDAPMNSTLYFTPEEKEDGMLRASEIYAQRFSAPLVVLSGCETGAGKWAKGEGVMNLARAFIHSGASEVVVSLWQAGDFSAARIMQKFYQQLVQQVAADQALCQAKREYLTSADEIGGHPYFWAGYVGIGNPNIKIKAEKASSFLWWLFCGLGAVFVVGLLIFRRYRSTAPQV